MQEKFPYHLTVRRIFTIICGFITLGWILWTLFLIVRYGGAVFLDFSTTGRIWSVRNGDDITSAIGLTYHGIEGAALVILELSAVLASLILAMRQHLKLRRTGLVILVAWSSLWLANALWMERLTGGDHVALTIPIAIATVVVFTLAAFRWRANGSVEGQA